MSWETDTYHELQQKGRSLQIDDEHESSKVYAVEPLGNDELGWVACNHNGHTSLLLRRNESGSVFHHRTKYRNLTIEPNIKVVIKDPKDEREETHTVDIVACTSETHPVNLRVSREIAHPQVSLKVTLANLSPHVVSPSSFKVAFWGRCSFKSSFNEALK